MSDVPVQIEYNQDLAPLEELLRAVRRPGDFFVSGALALPMPRLEIEGAGVISFPVPEEQARRIIAAAERAPYGRGAETILDTSVRKVWQLAPAKVRLGGKSWPDSFGQILSKVKAGLGCGETAVNAELYKLLVYDAGGFFLPHRDTEKADGMFGTLVVSLPSAHRGGELIVRHAGREMTVDLSAADFSEIGFVAFYADCEHEVRPIVEGHRVCLVYNLILESAGKRGGRPLQAPDYEAEIARAADSLETALARGPVKIAWLLEHQYSPASLSFAGLKSADAARAQVLCKAAARAGCVAHLAIVHIEESGSAEPQWDGGYGYDDEDEDESGEDFEVIEVCDWKHYLDEWVAPDDRRADFGRIPIEPGELLPDGALDAEEPDEQRLMEASGNEGASFERSYHRASIVVWRRERYAEVLLQAGAAAAMPHLEELVGAATAKGAAAKARKEAVTLARRMLERWEPAPAWNPELPGRANPSRGALLDLLRSLGDANLVARFIAEIATKAYDGSENAALAATGSLLGAETTGRLLGALVAAKMTSRPCECADLLARLIAGAGAGDDSWRAAASHVAAAAVDRLAALKNPSPPTRFRSSWDEEDEGDERAEIAKPVTPAFMADLLDALARLESPSLRERAAASIAANAAVFDPPGIVVPALSLLAERHGLSISRDAAFHQLWDHAARFLLQRSEDPPEPPADWRQEIAFSCQCEDCRALQAFARDPAAHEHRFRVKKERRQHLHRTIDEHDLDMTHVTDRHGSPQTLVCTKTRRHHQQRCAQHARDRAAMSALAGLSHGPATRDAELAARLHAAGRRQSPATAKRVPAN